MRFPLDVLVDHWLPIMDQIGENWTRARKPPGWDRCDGATAVALLNDLRRHELRLMMNLFQPSVRDSSWHTTCQGLRRQRADLFFAAGATGFFIAGPITSSPASS
jgi:hypothetical protein